MKKMFLRFGAVALAFFMTACGNTGVGTGGQSSASNTTDATVSVAVVVGAHSNANVISVNAEEIENQVYNSCYSCGMVSLVRADGKPEEFLKVNIPEPSVDGLSDRKLKSIAEGYRNEILASFNTDGAAKYAEVDTLEAIRLAANSLQTVPSGDKYLVIADPGLSTTGYLDFCRNDLFNTPTDEIIDALEKEMAIPNLNGMNVIWLYLGQVAEPQPRLSEVQKAKLTEIWTGVLDKAGAASYNFRTHTAASAVYTGLPPVSTVNANAREIEIKPIEKIVLDSESVSFIGDKATFVNKEDAEKAISNVARILIDHPDNNVYVVGCTASATGKDDFCQKLSEARADAVVDVLESYGISSDRMTAVGLADHAPWHIPDLNEEGYQIEEYASQNRCVVVLDVEDPDYGETVAAMINL